VVVFLVDPAGAGEAAPQKGKASSNFAGNLDTGEKPGHGSGSP
jgi:hypothetical protein